MQVQLKWQDLSGRSHQPILDLPIAFGRSFGLMPSLIESISVRRMVLDSDQVEAYHALLSAQENQLIITDQNTAAGTSVNGIAQPRQAVANGDRISIGPFEIMVTILDPSLPAQNSSEATSQSLHPQPSPSTPSSSPSLSSQSNRQGSISGGAWSTSPQTSIHETSDQTSAVRASDQGETSQFGADGHCQRKVGFLFKRRCGRTTSAGCTDCRDGQLDPRRDLYADDYAYYPDYGYYGSGSWGYDYYRNRDCYTYDAATRNIDFNESDAASFDQEDDQDYEMDFDAS